MGVDLSSPGRCVLFVVDRRFGVACPEASDLGPTIPDVTTARPTLSSCRYDGAFLIGCIDSIVFMYISFPKSGMVAWSSGYDSSFTTCELVFRWGPQFDPGSDQTLFFAIFSPHRCHNLGSYREHGQRPHFEG